MDSQAKQKATHNVHSKFREFYPGDRVLVKDLRKEGTWWPGLVAEQSRPRSYMVVLNDGRVWNHHVNHVRRDSMDRAVTYPSREMESQDKRPDIPLSECVPSPSQAPSVSPADVHGEMESGQRQVQEEVPAVNKAPPLVIQSSEAACPPLCRSLKQSKVLFRLELLGLTLDIISDFESISITSCHEVVYVNCLTFCHLLFVGLTRKGEMWCIYSGVESGCMCCPFTCCYIRLRCLRDRVCHVLEVVLFCCVS